MKPLLTTTTTTTTTTATAAVILMCLLFAFVNVVGNHRTLQEIITVATNKNASSAATNNDDTGGLPSLPSLLLCNREQVRRGQWERVFLEGGPPYVPSDKRSICHEDFEQKPWPSWDWRPFHSTAKRCVFTAWDEHAFCDLASQLNNNNKTASSSSTILAANNDNGQPQEQRGNNNINNNNNNTQQTWKATMAIVGDSLSWEQYSSLVQLLGLPSKEQDAHKSRKYGIDHVQIGCDDGDWKLVYRRSDDWKMLPSVIESNRPNVLILNRGAHYVPDKKFLPQVKATVEYLKKWQRNCTRDETTCIVVLRTTVPGHPHCANFTVPSNSTEEMEANVADMSFYKGGTRTSVPARGFHWWDFQHQNELMIQAFSESGLAYEVMDAYDINILRPDKHRGSDCLHSCYPGKMEVYNQLTLHILKRVVLMSKSLDEMNTVVQ